ncbi:MAG: hypothetical protein LBF40_08140 [Deltaproteobacteria bacterium]|jgi:hypothetical protein|nr:hypothetical protein [Deltaproteobacteria bacterium]
MLMMLNEFEEMNNITSLLASVLNFPSTKGIPEDVTEAVRAAKKQMEELPQVIDDLNQAYNRYTSLDGTITRMKELASRAGSEKFHLSDEDRETMNEEFGNLAQVVANEAGQQHFGGTRLSLLSLGKAKAANRVLSYLSPVLENLGQEIKGQKSLIIEAIVETANFLGIIAMCYPDAKGIDELKKTLESLNLPRNIDDPVLMNPTLH